MLEPRVSTPVFLTPPVCFRPLESSPKGMRIRLSNCVFGIEGDYGKQTSKLVLKFWNQLSLMEGVGRFMVGRWALSTAHATSPSLPSLFSPFPAISNSRKERRESRTIVSAPVEREAVLIKEVTEGSLRACTAGVVGLDGCSDVDAEQGSV